MVSKPYTAQQAGARVTNRIRVWSTAHRYIMTKGWMSVNEISKLLNVQPNTVRAWKRNFTALSFQRVSDLLFIHGLEIQTLLVWSHSSEPLDQEIFFRKQAMDNLKKSRKN